MSPEQARLLKLEQIELALCIPRLAIAVMVTPPFGALMVTPGSPFARALVQVAAC
jgi:hypothetical protein